MCFSCTVLKGPPEETDLADGSRSYQDSLNVWEGQVMPSRVNPKLAGDSLWSGERQSLLPGLMS